MEGQYTPDDVDLLSEIRADILKRPSAYRAGETFLREQYGPERLHRDAFADWERFKDHPTQQASHRAVAQDMTRDIADPAEREARHREVLEQVSAPPKPERWTPAACACQAIQGLSDAMNGEHHDAKAQAVLLLAVMLWDADADKRHSIFTLFGPWGATPAGQIESVSRWAATYFLHEQSDLRHWMDTVRMAWKALPKPAAVAATVETVENLTRCARAYLTHLEGGRDLSFGLEKRVNEAATQVGLPAPFSRSEGAGENAKSIYVGYNDSIGEEAGYFRIVNHLGEPLPLSGEDRQKMTTTLRNLILEAEGRAAQSPNSSQSEPDLSGVLQGMDDEHGLTLPELARQIAALADDVEAGSYVTDPLRPNAADLSHAARLQFRDTSMERREVEPGRWQWIKRDSRNRPMDERRLEHHLCQALAVLGDLRDGRKAADTPTKLRAIAKGIEQTAPKAGDEQPDAQADAKPASAPGKGMTWQQAMKAAEDHCARNPFPGVNALAKIVRQTTGRTCSKATIRKAIDHSAKLRARQAEHDAQRKSVSAGAMTEAVAESAKQTREPDPIDAASASTDDLFHRLVEQAKPSERAKLNAMTPDDRRKLVATIAHDPDEQAQERRRKAGKPRTR